MRRVLLPSLFLGACLEGSSGTAVGNPGKVELTATSIPSDLTLDRIELSLDTARITACEDITLDLAIPDTPLAVDGTTMTIPGGSFCVLELSSRPAGLFLTGETDGGTAFQLAYSPQALVYDAPFFIDGDALLVAFDIEMLVGSGAAIDAADTDDDGQLTYSDSELDDSTDLDGTLEPPPAFSGELWADVDGDGRVGPEDTAPNAPGCSTVAPVGPAFLFVLPFVLRRRVRRRGPTT